MTAQASRRRRRTVFGGLFATTLLCLAIALALVGALTLRDSEEGETVGIDDRPVTAFPSTPNLLLAIADDEGRLTSLAVLTLLPDGVGGNLITVPVNADATVGLGADRQPLSSVFAADDPEGFVPFAESLLSITIERVEVLGPDELAEFLEPFTPIEASFPEDVVDSDTIGSGIIVTAGDQTMRTSLAVDALTAIDATGDVYDRHILDVEMWTAIAARAPIGTVTVETVPQSTDGRPAPPETNAEFFDRFWSGTVQVRDLDIDPGLTATAENPDDIDMVVVDRRDSLLVFTQISPSLVSAPNPGLTFRLEVRYSDDQLAAASGETDLSRSQVARTLIGELLFFQANVVSVDPAADSGGAPSVTRIEVAQERFVEELIEFAPLMFGETDVVVATELLDGVDAVVKLGTGYLSTLPQPGGDTVVVDE